MRFNRRVRHAQQKSMRVKGTPGKLSQPPPPPKSNSCPKVALLGPRRKFEILFPTRSIRSHAWDKMGGRCAAASTRRPSERWRGFSQIDCWGLGMSALLDQPMDGPPTRSGALWEVVLARGKRDIKADVARVFS